MTRKCFRHTGSGIRHHDEQDEKYVLARRCPSVPGVRFERRPVQRQRAVGTGLGALSQNGHTTGRGGTRTGPGLRRLVAAGGQKREDGGSAQEQGPGRPGRVTPAAPRAEYRALHLFPRVTAVLLNGLKYATSGDRPGKGSSAACCSRRVHQAAARRGLTSGAGARLACRRFCGRGWPGACSKPSPPTTGRGRLDGLRDADAGDRGGRSRGDDEHPDAAADEADR